MVPSPGAATSRGRWIGTHRSIRAKKAITFLFSDTSATMNEGVRPVLQKRMECDPAEEEGANETEDREAKPAEHDHSVHELVPVVACGQGRRGIG
jgi:hypothetical protein